MDGILGNSLQTTYRRVPGSSVAVCPTVYFGGKVARLGYLIGDDRMPKIAHVTANDDGPTRLVPSSFPAAPARACGRCRARRRPSRSCRCRTARRCSARPRAARSRCPGVDALRHGHQPRLLLPHQGRLCERWRRARRGDASTCSSRSAATRRPRSRSARCARSAHGGRRRAAGAAGRPPDPRPARVRRRGRARRRRSRATGRSSRSASRPTHPETGFGYIECGDSRCRARATPAAYRARRFVEKPPLADARASISPPATTCGTRACSLHAGARSSPRSSATRPACSPRRGRSWHALAATRRRRCSRSTPRCSPPCPTSRSTTR